MAVNVTQIINRISTNVDMGAKMKKIWNPATCVCKNSKYLGSIIHNLVIRCDEVIELTKSISTKTVPTKNTSTNFYTLLAFY